MANIPLRPGPGHPDFAKNVTTRPYDGGQSVRVQGVIDHLEEIGQSLQQAFHFLGQMESNPELADAILDELDLPLRLDLDILERTAKNLRDRLYKAQLMVKRERAVADLARVDEELAEVNSAGPR